MVDFACAVSGICLILFTVLILTDLIVSAVKKRVANKRTIEQTLTELNEKCDAINQKLTKEDDEKKMGF